MAENESEDRNGSDSCHPINPVCLAYYLARFGRVMWVADLTYVRLRFEVVYFAVVMDGFARQIRDWRLAKSLDTRLSQVALERVVA